jgi:hypothetical protein
MGVNPVRKTWCGFNLQRVREVISNGVNPKIRLIMAVLLFGAALPANAGSIIGWGNQVIDSTEFSKKDHIAIAEGSFHCLALKSDGSIVGWGYDKYGQASPPDGNDFIAISAGWWHSLALKSDGSIVGWGDDRHGEATTPTGNDFIAIAAGGYYSIALTAEKPKLGIVSKERIDRTRFIYDCNATFTNLYSFAVNNVEIIMTQVPDNMTIVEPNVTFGGIEFWSRQSITSTDTCTFIVDRAEPIDAEKIVWKVRCERADNGMPIELTINGVDSLDLEGIASDGEVNLEDLAELCLYWLQNEPSADIEPPGGDGIIDFLDFARIAEDL